MTTTTVELGHPRIRVRVENLTPAEVAARLVINPQLKLLIDKILVRNPKWHVTIKGVFSPNTYPMNYNSSTHVHTLNYAKVYQGDEVLGDIGCEDYGDRKYILNNPSLTARRSRGSDTRTGKLDKALKIVADNFKPKSVDEIFERAVLAKHNALSIRANSKHIAFTSHMTKAQDAVMQFLEANWYTARQELWSRYRVPEDHADKLLGSYQDYVQAKEMYDSAGTTIAMHGGMYLMQVDKVVEAYGDVPENLRANLGILKMVDPSSALPGVGVRVEENIFYVIPR